MSNESLLALAAIIASTVEAAKLVFEIVKWRDEHHDRKDSDKE